MARRQTVDELPSSPRWDPSNAPMRLNPDTGEMERTPVLEPFTREQKRRAREMARQLVAEAQSEMRARLKDVRVDEDPFARVRALHEAQQLYEITYKMATEQLDEEMRRVVDEQPPGTVSVIADITFLTDSRVRQILSADNRGLHEGEGMGQGAHAKRVRETLTQDVLEQMYFLDKKPIRQIADELEVSESTVSKYLHNFFDDHPKWGDKFRSAEDYPRRSTNGRSRVRDQLSRDMLQREYFKKGRSMEAIASEFGVSHTTVGTRIHELFDDDPELGPLIGEPNRSETV